MSRINLNLVRVGEVRVRRATKRTRNHSTSARTQGQDLSKHDNSLSAGRNCGIMYKRNVTKDRTRGNMNERNAIKEKTQLKETLIVESPDMIVKKRKKAEENGNIVKLKKAGKNKTDIDVNSSMATYKNIISSELSSAQGIGENKMISQSSSKDMYSSIKCSENSSSNKKTRRCNKCKNCLQLNCKSCSACKNMKKYDGLGTKESCLRRSNCLNVCAPTLERKERGGTLQKNSLEHQDASKSKIEKDNVDDGNEKEKIHSIKESNVNENGELHFVDDDSLDAILNHDFSVDICPCFEDEKLKQRQVSEILVSENESEAKRIQPHSTDDFSSQLKQNITVHRSRSTVITENPRDIMSEDRSRHTIRMTGPHLNIGMNGSHHDSRKDGLHDTIGMDRPQYTISMDHDYANIASRPQDVMRVGSYSERVDTPESIEARAAVNSQEGEQPDVAREWEHGAGLGRAQLGGAREREYSDDHQVAGGGADGPRSQGVNHVVDNNVQVVAGSAGGFRSEEGNHLGENNTPAQGGNRSGRGNCGACGGNDKMKIKMEIKLSITQFIEVAHVLPLLGSFVNVE